MAYQALHLRCDSLLRFEPQIQRRYEAEHGPERLSSLRKSIVVGLLFYNMYNLSAIALMPDIFWLSVFLRVAVVTSASIGIAWVLGYLSPRHREQLVLCGVINAYAFPLWLFWYTRAPLGNYSFGELSLHLIFGNMLLALRFRYAIVFTTLCFAASAITSLLKPGISQALALSFALQSLTACAFSLYANYQIERRRCLDYLSSLQARLMSEEAKRAEKRYRDLSLTDPLTGLMNRRALEQRIERLFTTAQPKTALMIDVDYFKSLNDTEGHAHGDRVLAQLAECLTRAADRFSKTCDGNVWCARFGGEEFMVVANIDEVAAGQLARTVIDAVHHAHIPHPVRPDALDYLTVSIGIAYMGPHTKRRPIDLLVSADTALYEAKRLGRNRLVFSGTEQAINGAA